MVNEDLKQRALAYLAQHQVVTVATNGADGPWAAALFYVNKDFDLFFLSASHTRHAQNIAVNPGVAAAIHEDYRDWPEIKGVQLEGKALLLQGAERAKAIALYQGKYPFLAQKEPEMQAALEKVGWYMLSPERFYFIDNSRGFGHRDEIPLT